MMGEIDIIISRGCQIRVGDLMKWDDFAAKFTALQKYFRKLEQENGLPSVDVEKELELYKGCAELTKRKAWFASALQGLCICKGSFAVLDAATLEVCEDH